MTCAIAAQGARPFDDLFVNIRNRDLQVKIIEVKTAQRLQSLEMMPQFIERLRSHRVEMNLFQFLKGRIGVLR